jgi:tripartite-type tricarboxylate transporter receptor subunit TctC
MRSVFPFRFMVNIMHSGFVMCSLWSVVPCVMRAIAYAWIVIYLSVTPSMAQDYPTRQVAIVVPFPAGGSVDPIARALVQHMIEMWNQPVIIVNRPGAGGTVGSDYVARAPKDGYTLLMGSTSLAISPSLYIKMPYDVLKDLTPVTMVVITPNFLTVHPALPTKSVKELIALARSKPGVLNSASAGVGTSNHLSLAMFNSMAGVDIVHVAYKGGAPALTDVMGGHIAMSFFPFTVAMTQVHSGKLRALAVTSAKRSSSVPDMPTVSEAGVPGYEATSWSAVMAPAGTPRDVINRINVAIAESLRAPKVKDVLAVNGAEAVGNSPDEFARMLRAEMAKWAKVVKSAGIKPE